MPKLNLTKRQTKKNNDHPKNDDSNDDQSETTKPGITRISLVSKSITDDKKPRGRTRLIDKLETPAARQKRTGNETTFSLVDKNRPDEIQLPMRQSTCIVCLKINKSLFNQIFSHDGKSDRHSESLDPFKTHEESISNMSAELQMELSQDKTLDVPQIYVNIRV